MEEFLKKRLKETSCCQLAVSFASFLLIFILHLSGGGLFWNFQKIDSTPWGRIHCANSHMCIWFPIPNLNPLSRRESLPWPFFSFLYSDHLFLRSLQGAKLETLLFLCFWTVCAFGVSLGFPSHPACMNPSLPTLPYPSNTFSQPFWWHAEEQVVSPIFN